MYKIVTACFGAPATNEKFFKFFHWGAIIVYFAAFPFLIFNIL